MSVIKIHEKEDFLSFKENAHSKDDISFPCDQCDNSFASSKQLMAHIREADNHEAVCKACDKTFKNFDNMRHHKRKYHYERLETEFVCHSCGKGCKTRELLKDHWNYVHKVETDLNCNLCGRSCQNMLKLKKHMKMCLSRDPYIVEQERLQFEETTCYHTLGFESKSNEEEAADKKSVNASFHDGEEGEKSSLGVKENSNNRQSEGNELIMSGVVKDEFKFDVSHLTEQKLKEGDTIDENDQIKTAIEEGYVEEVATLNELDTFEAFETVQEVENMIKIETEPDISELMLPLPIKKKRQRKRTKVEVVAKVCPICAKEVKYLNGHIKDVHTTETSTENHICNHCGKVFTKLKKLRGHIDAVHRGDPSMCDICSQVFKNPHALRGHKRKVHEETGEVTCQSCFKVFATKLKLYYHDRAVHTQEDARCQACGRSYKNRNLLQKHQRVYHKELYQAQKKYFEQLSTSLVQGIASQPGTSQAGNQSM